MSIKSFKLHEDETKPDIPSGLVHVGGGGYAKKKGDQPTHRRDKKTGKVLPIAKSDIKDKPADTAKKSKVSTGKPSPGKLSDKDDALSDGGIKQIGLDIGYKKTKFFKPAPGNAGSMMAEIMSGEAYNILALKPTLTEEELTTAIYNEVKDTALGRQNTKGANYKNKFDGRNQNLWKLCTSIAKSGKQKYKMQEAGIERLSDEGKITPPAKTRNFYGHEVSLARQKELIEKTKGPYYTDQGVEIPKDTLLDLIANSGGGENPSDTSTITVDSKGAAVVAFHSDKISTADIQANTTVNKGFEDKSTIVDGTTLSDKLKGKAKSIIDESSKAFSEAETALKNVGQSEATEMAGKDMGKVLDDIKNNRNSKDPVASRLKVILQQRSKKAGGGSLFQDYIEVKNPTEEDLLKGFYKYMADADKDFEPTNDMVTFFQRSAAQQGFNLKSQISEIRERSITIQRDAHAKLNSTKVKMKNGTEKGLGDYIEGVNFAEKMHINIVDGEKGKGIGRFPGVFKLNMGGVIVEGKQIGEALGIDSTDDFITHLEVGTPEDGEEFTYADKEKTQITGRNIFVYAISKDGKKLPVGFKTQRSKQGPTGKLQETFQWSSDVQKKFKSLNIDEESSITSFSESTKSLEERELAELFGSIPFNIDVLKWSSKHGGQRPKGNDTWKFDYKVPVRSMGNMVLDDGEFTFRGAFKKAVQALVKYLKKSVGPKGIIKQAKVVLKP